MYTIATAGHIDHGKSSLVRALTGIDPDRLPEEKARQMTIELGFAHFQLPSGREVGIIDVPGHERFIKTMISGVGAIDFVMFVIAADDGWMPQSEEHLAILQHLGVERGMIVLTKVDLVEREWINLVKAELRQRTEGTFLAGCPIVEFSAVDERNLSQVSEAINAALSELARRESFDSARLFVDRVFSVAGTGTVVTGTLREGRLKVGQEIFVHPAGTRTRVKSLESFNAHLESAEPGIRLAVGLQSVEKVEVNRGDVVYYPNELTGADTIGVRLVIEGGARRFVKHGREVTLLHGTAELEARLQLAVDTEPLPDGNLIAVLRLAASSVFKTGDHFILRLTTPSLLIGGGQVIDPNLRNFRRRDTEVWSALRGACDITVKSTIIYELAARKVVSRSRVLFQSQFLRRQVEPVVKSLIDSGHLLALGDDLVLDSVWQGAQSLILSEMTAFHTAHPHQSAYPLAELTSKLALPAVLVEAALEALIRGGKLVRRDSGIKIAAYSAELTPVQERLMQRIISLLKATPISCLSREELFALDKEARKVYTFLRQNEIIIDAGGTVYLKESFDAVVGGILAHLKAAGKITVAEARNLTNSSRKFVLPILEEMDRRRITKRDDDYRVLWQ